LDIGTGIVGQADLTEEIARIYGYSNIPNTIIADAMPQQRSNRSLELEEHTRDLLVALGLRENISYRLTTPEREALLVPQGAASSLPDAGYVTLANPIAVDKVAMRHTLLANLLTNAQNNARYTDRQQTFEIGSIYLQREGQLLPDEPRRLGILMTGKRALGGWMGAQDTDATQNVEFFDLKGIVEELLESLRIKGASYRAAEHTSFHPGRSASVSVGAVDLGVFGELHPRVAERFELTDAPVLLAEFDLDALLDLVPDITTIRRLPTTPPVLQDIALIVPAEMPAEKVATAIAEAGGDLLRNVRLFDVYQGGSVPEGSKSLAYSLTYQADERTLTDDEVAKVHARIVRTVERNLGAKLRA
jgi:phenylalanyl-tRNA synthetase beta chain